MPSPVAKLVSATPSLFQHVALYEHPEFGFQLYLDDTLTCSTNERDYFNALVTPVVQKSELDQVLILGGGHGLTAQELLNHCPQSAKNSIRISLVEIDIDVIRLCKTYLPVNAQKVYQHPQIDLIIGDAFTMINHQRRLDAVIIDVNLRPNKEDDLTDYLDKFFKVLRKSLKPCGVFSLKLADSPFKEESQENVSLIQQSASQHFESINLQWLSLASSQQSLGILSGVKTSESQ